MTRVLFVVHRYGAPGGSEYNVRNMAEECAVRGWETCVLTDVAEGSPEFKTTVRVTTDRNIAITQKWDLIVVHGSCPTQDFIHINSHYIRQQSPILYLLIKPSEAPLALYGMQQAQFIGCGTKLDWDHVKKFGVESKGRDFVYGIPSTVGTPGFRRRYGIYTTRLFVSAGGFWPHKGMEELKQAFLAAQVPDTTLVLMGYDDRHRVMPQPAPNVKVLLGTTHGDVLGAMAEGDLYILNSSDEGYGLVILESMLNGVSWLARPVGGIPDMAHYGTLYNSFDELVYYLKHWAEDVPKVRFAHDYVTNHHLAEHSVNSLARVITEIQYGTQKERELTDSNARS